MGEWADKQGVGEDREIDRQIDDWKDQGLGLGCKLGLLVFHKQRREV